MKTLRLLVDRINGGILKIQVLEAVIDDINPESRTNKKERENKKDA